MPARSIMPLRPTKKSYTTKATTIWDAELARYRAVMQATCDDCGLIEYINVGGRVHSLPDNVSQTRFIELGWSFKGGKPRCPKHTARSRQHVDREIVTLTPAPAKPPEENMAEAQPIRTLEALGDATVRQMAPEDRRKITRVLFDNWDDKAGRYIGKMTDHLLALELKLPRAWVETVRFENFGDTGSNEEIETLRRDLDATEKKYVDAVERAMAFAGSLDAMREEVKVLRRRLERVETATLPRGR